MSKPVANELQGIDRTEAIRQHGLLRRGIFLAKNIASLAGAIKVDRASLEFVQELQGVLSPVVEQRLAAYVEKRTKPMFDVPSYVTVDLPYTTEGRRTLLGLAACRAGSRLQLAVATGLSISGLEDVVSRTRRASDRITASLQAWLTDHPLKKRPKAKELKEMLTLPGRWLAPKPSGTDTPITVVATQEPRPPLGTPPGAQMASAENPIPSDPAAKLDLFRKAKLKAGSYEALGRFIGRSGTAVHGAILQRHPISGDLLARVYRWYYFGLASPSGRTHARSTMWSAQTIRDYKLPAKVPTDQDARRAMVYAALTTAGSASELSRRTELDRETFRNVKRRNSCVSDKTAAVLHRYLQGALPDRPTENVLDAALGNWIPYAGKVKMADATADTITADTIIAHADAILQDRAPSPAKAPVVSIAEDLSAAFADGLASFDPCRLVASLCEEIEHLLRGHVQNATVGVRLNGENRILLGLAPPKALMTPTYEAYLGEILNDSDIDIDSGQFRLRLLNQHFVCVNPAEARAAFLELLRDPKFIALLHQRTKAVGGKVGVG